MKRFIEELKKEFTPMVPMLVLIALIPICTWTSHKLATWIMGEDSLSVTLIIFPLLMAFCICTFQAWQASREDKK